MIFPLWKTLRATLFVALIFLSGLRPAESSSRIPFETTCLWVVRNSILSERSIEEVVEFARDHGIQHLFVQVRGRGDAFYESGLVPRSALLADDKFDPLATIIRIAHENGIKVHAWVNVYILWSSAQAPYSSDHLFNTHPEWLDNSGTAKTPKTMLKQYKDGNGRDEGIYLAPHHPEVNPYLLAVFRELVAKYPVDGLHLDYIRYKDSQFGKNSDALDHYKLSQGEDPMEFLSSRGTKEKNDTQFSSKITRWGDHKRQAITSLVRDLKGLLDEIRPGCLLSAAVKPNLYEARDRYFQEWDVWLAAGYLDWAVPMNYTTSLRGFAKNIDIIYDNLPEKYRAKIIMGIGAYNQKAPDAADKIKYTRITRFPGVALFSYNVFKTNPLYFTTMNQGFFK